MVHAIFSPMKHSWHVYSSVRGPSVFNVTGTMKETSLEIRLFCRTTPITLIKTLDAEVVEEEEVERWRD